MKKIHPVALFKKQSTPVKVAAVAVALILVGKLMMSKTGSGAFVMHPDRNNGGWGL